MRLALRQPSVRVRGSKPRTVSKPGPGGRRGSTSRPLKSRRPRKLPQRYSPKPPEAGAKDITLSAFALLRGPVGLALLVALAAIDFWRRLNQRKPTPSDGPVGPSVTIPIGDYSAVGQRNANRRVINYVAGDFSAGFGGNVYTQDNGWEERGGPFLPGMRRIVNTSASNSGNDLDAAPTTWQNGRDGQDWQVFDQEGNSVGSLFNGFYMGGFITDAGSYNWDMWRSTIYIRDGDGEPIPEPWTLDDPIYPPFAGETVPAFEPLEAPIDLPTVVPDVLPLVVPVGVPFIQPAPANLPAPRPARRRVGAPRLAPTAPSLRRSQPAGVQQLTALRVVPALAPVRPPLTPPGAVKIGELLLGGPGTAPAPTLPAIASELGRIEQKTEALLNRGAAGGVPADLLPMFVKLAEFLASFDDGGSYLLPQPCAVGSDGEPLPDLVVQFPPTIGPGSGTRARVDALAELIRLSKLTKQPICKGRAIGVPTTVTFEEGGE